MSVDCFRASNEHAPLWDSLYVVPYVEMDGCGFLQTHPPGTYMFAATYRQPQVGWTPLEDWQPPSVPAARQEPVHYKETFLSAAALVEAGSPFNAVRVALRTKGPVDETTPSGHFLAFYASREEEGFDVWRPFAGWVRVKGPGEKIDVRLGIPKPCDPPSAAVGNVIVTGRNAQPKPKVFIASRSSDRTKEQDERAMAEETRVRKNRRRKEKKANGRSEGAAVGAIAWGFVAAAAAALVWSLVVTK